MKFSHLRYPFLKVSLRSPSLLVIIFSVCFAFWLVDFWRPYNAAKGESNFVWDIFGYYSYLPSAFCNDGSFDWKGDMPKFLPLAPNGQYYPKYTYGMSILYAPFFALGYKVAINQKDPLNGFSEPFATCVHWGSMIYILIGMLFLRKFLLRYFNEPVTALTLFAALFGTMLFMYSYIQSEMPHGYLFALFAVFLYYTDKWYEVQKYRYTIILAFTGALITLIRPTEIFMLLFFLLWNVRRLSDVKEKLRFLYRNYTHILIIFVSMIVIWIPQLIIWEKYTGDYFFFSYQNEGFFWNDPQILNILFSYRKGWFTYTPLILLSFIGFCFMSKDFPISRWVMFVITSVMIYVFSCWWDWNYGGCFGARAFCQQIAFLSIPLASFMHFVLYSEKKFLGKGLLTLATIVFLFSTVCLNVGQSYQYQQLRKIHPWGMTEKVYWDIFRTFQFSEAYNYQFWADIKLPEHDKWMKGEKRDDR